jgi:hypothetical protein
MVLELPLTEPAGTSLRYDPQHAEPTFTFTAVIDKLTAGASRSYREGDPHREGAHSGRGRRDVRSEPDLPHCRGEGQTERLSDESPQDFSGTRRVAL